VSDYIEAIDIELPLQGAYSRMAKEYLLDIRI